MAIGALRVQENTLGNILKSSLEMVLVQEANEATCESLVGFYVCSVYTIPGNCRNSSN